MKTYSIEPEFGERCIVKLKEPFANGDSADISAALLFIPLSGSCISIRVLQHNAKNALFSLSFLLLDKEKL